MKIQRLKGMVIWLCSFLFQRAVSFQPEHVRISIRRNSRSCSCTSRNPYYCRMLFEMYYAVSHSDLYPTLINRFTVHKRYPLQTTLTSTSSYWFTTDHPSQLSMLCYTRLTLGYAPWRCYRWPAFWCALYQVCPNEGRGKTHAATRFTGRLWTAPFWAASLLELAPHARRYWRRAFERIRHAITSHAHRQISAILDENPRDVILNRSWFLSGCARKSVERTIGRTGNWSGPVFGCNIQSALALRSEQPKWADVPDVMMTRRASIPRRSW